MMWNLARRLAWCAAGHSWDTFTIVDVVSAGAPPMFGPHVAPVQGAPNAPQAAQPGAASGVRKLKMNIIKRFAGPAQVAVAYPSLPTNR